MREELYLPLSFSLDRIEQKEDHFDLEVLFKLKGLMYYGRVLQQKKVDKTQTFTEVS